MQVLSKQDYEVIKQIVSLSQKQLKGVMAQFLRKHYKRVITTNDYIVAIGDIPIALVAHMDTVFKTPVVDLYYDKEKNVMWSPEGLGADDRAGVFAILKIIKDGYRPSVILTTDEEKGGIGASILSQKKCPIKDLKYLIELDRRGKDDCVFYDCYNEKFIKYIEQFGFHEEWGSFSDISFLMGDWLVCGVNLSIGYRNEHSEIETLHIDDLFNTIHKVEKMLSEKDIPDFEYMEFVYDYTKLWASDKYGKIYGQHCSQCKTLHSEYELFPAKTPSGTLKYFCPDCIVGHVEWCEYCGEAFEIVSPAKEKICKECADQLLCIVKSKNNSNQ